MKKVADMTTDPILTNTVPKEDPASARLGQYDREADPVLAMNANKPGAGAEKGDEVKARTEEDEAYEDDEPEVYSDDPDIVADEGGGVSPG
ncbi:hypothetical protein ALP36_03478 [Pseudomonas syringae pv. coriandricola]|uniref:Uncharacterized protein n=4 Tax=Pseudomonas syringae group TaxID=136849 RepID=A0A3M5RM31_9PSED|nr:hypothetical protein A256_23114 [Pseudomonas syringae pv. actinidiae ICMP 19103]EPM83993.1 hypothetical protein A260_23510 [Pseudomonas syringae pv. actinidiae ICMP 19068]EPN08391.1 hypothetical protein A252_22990 [Pseudomonas syringae pv. actinidiae ICMP 9855]EPN24365.1 hypothetical protein A259_04946 [Pseudomonas syringae pv. actinidiae ICMP 19070]KPW59987.1 Uncharacterized protein ALO86_00048 [Pseudomonas syringae pv. berberidis]KPY13244.1 Uncharacterized protein ALO54_03927 [Pseudomonas